MTMKRHKPKNIPVVVVPKINRILNKRVTVYILLIIICMIGIPLRAQNLKLNGYISDDAWWHFRQVKQVVETGHRLNPDIYEFTTLNRAMTYPPLFHYLVASTYNSVKLIFKGLPLIRYTHYFNILEGMLYILLIYWISLAITNDALFSLIGALGTSVAYGVIIRARAGELMPFVPSDLLAFAGILLLIFVLKDTNGRKAILLCMASGVFFGLSTLAWSGSVLIYLPLILFAFLALIIHNPKSVKLFLKLSAFFLAPFLIIFLPWYLSLVTKFGINPHPKEMDWFMKNFTVLHQVKPLPFYIFTAGIPIFFVPIVLLMAFFKRNALKIFVISWILLAAIATYSGWRGYVAMGPIISCVAISVGLSWIVRSIFKRESIITPIIFIVMFLVVGVSGYIISDSRIKPLNPNNIGEIRTNAFGLKMLEFLKEKYPNAIAVDHITWVSEDEAIGSLRMIAGQYLEYLPPGSSDALKDVSRIYLSDEEKAYNICRKYNVDLIIVRSQFMQLPQLSILFGPPEFKTEDYFKILQEYEGSPDITINFTQLGMQTMFFKMLSVQPLKLFELVYLEPTKNGPLPFLAVYKVNKQLPQ